MILSQQQIYGLEEQHLVLLKDGNRLLKDVAGQFALMQQAAEAHGFDLQICSSFRSFDRQMQIWNAKWEGKRPLFDLQNNPVDSAKLSPLDKVHAIMLWSALPGASRHHWGTDFDYYDKTAVDKCDAEFLLVPEEYENSGPCAGLSSWINNNAHRFGFTLPYKDYVGGVAREPWHLSYRPLADNIIESLSLMELEKLLCSSKLLGKEAVIPQLEVLFTRYTLNKGTQ